MNKEILKKVFFLLFISIFFIPGLVLAEETDSDQDGLTDEQEIIYGTDINLPDTDHDGFPDGLEIESGYSPLQGNNKKLTQVDTDGDAMNDYLELKFGTKLNNKDSDGDGYWDFGELLYGYDALSSSTTKKDRYVEVDLTNQRLYFVVDKIKILDFAVSTGNIETPTPTGTFKIINKIPVKRYRGADYDYPNVKWNMEFKPGYFLHSSYWHNGFGLRTRSHGCVNMKIPDAEILYKYTEKSMPVIITGKTPKKYFVGT